MLTNELKEETSHTVVFDVIPVIHLRGGRTIDFTGNNPDESAIFEEWEPLETAKFWIEEGASRIHVVDIDALFQRDATLNWQLITRLCELPVKVQLVAGHLDMKNIDRAIQAGVSRVMLDASQEDINLLASSAVSSYGPDAIGVMFTTRAVGKVGTIEETEDWPEDWAGAGGEQVVSRALQMYRLGIHSGIHTTIADNGEMSGCDVRITKELASLSGVNFQVGGEIYDMDDIASCYNCKGVSGVLIGRALYNGNISLKRALRTTRRKIAFDTGLPAWKQEQDTVKARLRYQLTRHYLHRHLPDRSLHILDAGGGNGQDALLMAGAGHTVALVDESAAMLADFQEANELSPVASSITTHHCNLRDIPENFDEDDFDVVLCHNVIQYVTDWQEQLRNAVKPLKKGGIFSLVTRNQLALPYLIDLETIEIDQLSELSTAVKTHSPFFESEITLYRPTDLTDWLTDNGFDLIGRYGLLTLNHYASTVNSPENQMLISKLEQFEANLGEVSPYRDTARYIQVLAKKC
jgi:S-adenosylmethionine-dependent methyltransferase